MTTDIGWDCFLIQHRIIKEWITLRGWSWLIEILSITIKVSNMEIKIIDEFECLIGKLKLTDVSSKIVMFVYV